MPRNFRRESIADSVFTSVIPKHTTHILVDDVRLITPGIRIAAGVNDCIAFQLDGGQQNIKYIPSSDYTPEKLLFELQNIFYSFRDSIEIRYNLKQKTYSFVAKERVFIQFRKGLNSFLPTIGFPSETHFAFSGTDLKPGEALTSTRPIANLYANPHPQGRIEVHQALQYSAVASSYRAEQNKEIYLTVNSRLGEEIVCRDRGNKQIFNSIATLIAAAPGFPAKFVSSTEFKHTGLKSKEKHLVVIIRDESGSILTSIQEGKISFRFKS